MFSEKTSLTSLWNPHNGKVKEEQSAAALSSLSPPRPPWFLAAGHNGRHPKNWLSGTPLYSSLYSQGRCLRRTHCGSLHAGAGAARDVSLRAGRLPRCVRGRVPDRDLHSVSLFCSSRFLSAFFLHMVIPSLLWQSGSVLPVVLSQFVLNLQVVHHFCRGPQLPEPLQSAFPCRRPSGREAIGWWRGS